MRIHWIVGLVLGTLLMVGGPAAAIAQEATPDSGASLLSGYGLPEVVIEATDAGVTDPGELAAGLTLITFDNQSGADATLELYPTADQAAYDALIELFATGQEAMMLPPEFYEITISGGISAPAGASAGVILDLVPGLWAFNYFVADEAGPGINIPTAVEVTGEPNGMSPPEADVVAEMYEMEFTIPDEVAAGPQVWEVTTTGMQPHFVLMSRYPEAFTDEQVMELLTSFDPTGTPDPSSSALQFDLFEDAFESPVLSSGQTNWYEIDLEPGYYVALCFIPDPETGAPHALLGMHELFEVV